VLANKAMDQFGGSESYLITVAEQLQRLGHEVIAYTPEPGGAADIASERGIRVASSPDELPAGVDGTLAQDGMTAYQLAALYPEARRVYVSHSTYWEPQRPPQLPHACHAVVALNDLAKRRCEALAHCPELVRLRQPVDVRRFRFGVRRPEPRRVLAFGNHWTGERYRIVADACEELGLELELVGFFGRITSAPELDIADADVVIGLGRCVLEAMALGRAAYVYGVHGGDGWVTPDSYHGLEAEGFAGRATDKAIDARRLRADLERFDPGMGIANRDLALRHHDAGFHAEELVELFRTIEARPADGRAPFDELSRLVRIHWETELRASKLESKATANVVQRQDAERERDRWRAEYEHTASRLRELHAAYNRLIGTRRWRFVSALAKPLDLYRRYRGRAGPG
jgi:hypothetical protein